ncbi:hypothetical protein BJV38_000988 [Clostridium beijerinckii]|nr:MULTISPECIES: hypothetical protein [Clostridium]MBA8933657.1 hypothetical protein [Clostridium beijerinckii]NRT44145.1 hypothetical protein [Clostridium beijerinckii]NRZ21861.1 hypothetical protein [Clostridium beijerinckii]CUU49589.1 protein of unknown function [Clostridium beijerinckii]
MVYYNKFIVIQITATDLTDYVAKKKISYHKITRKKRCPKEN